MPGKSRDYYIDRIRVLLTALVIFHHSAVTYGAPGGWFYREPPRSPSGSPPMLLLTLFVATNQAYFMGFFFLLAGYYTPGSLDRKGTRQFLLDRFVRLGLPLLAFGFLLAPLTIWLAAWPQHTGFGAIAAYLWQHHQFENGPLWFAQALLLFTLGYVGWRAVRHSPATAAPVPTDPPANLLWLAAAIVVGLGAVAIRLFVPTGQNVFGLQLGFFASYVVLFAVGIAAWYGRWLETLRWNQTLRWLIVAVLAIPTLPATLLLAKNAKPAQFSGGLSGPALLYAFWEPFVAWGIIAAILFVMRERFNQPSAAWSRLGRLAFPIFIVHPPVLVACSMLLRPWDPPTLLKFAVVGTLACIGSWLVAELLVRIPGVRQVI